MVMFTLGTTSSRTRSTIKKQVSKRIFSVDTCFKELRLTCVLIAALLHPLFALFCLFFAECIKFDSLFRCDHCFQFLVSF